MEILVYAEHKKGELKRVTYEILSKGREIVLKKEGRLSAVILGDKIEKAVEELSFIVDRLYVFEDPSLEFYNSDRYSQLITRLIERERPFLILGGSTIEQRDLFPSVAGILEKGIVVDCISIELENGNLSFIKPFFGGKILGRVLLKEEGGIVLARPRAFDIADLPKTKANIIKEKVEIDGSEVKIKNLNIEKSGDKAVDITEADIVVCGGRGFKSPENFALLEELAEALNAQVGVTRAVVDAGWRPQSEQVGKSGKTVSPNLYFAIGLSGAIHHIMGMDGAKVVVAINKDPMAPIFQYADYCVVGDLFELIPCLLKEIRKKD